MVTKWHRWLGVAGIVGSLGLAALAPGQSTPFQPLKNLFGSKTPAADGKVESNRTTEIRVEMAWLSDTATFPYYLEAHVKGTTLEVRGYVPSRAVRTQALNVAQLNCSLTVVDAMKEHNLLTVRATKRAPEELKSAAQIALHDVFPRQTLIVQARPDGNVEISGNVRSLEQKLAVSQALRRLHGCTSVTNATQVDGLDVARQPVAAKMPSPTPVEQTSKGPPPEKRGVFGLFSKTPTPPAAAQKSETAPVKITTVDTSSSGLQPAGPTLPTTAAQNKPADAPENPGVIVVSGNDSKKNNEPQAAPAFVPPAKTAPGTSATAAQLKKSIETAFPGLRNVSVTFTSKSDVRVECTLRPGDDTGAVAGQILSLQALSPYKVNLQVQVPAAAQK